MCQLLPTTKVNVEFILSLIGTVACGAWLICQIIYGASHIDTCWLSDAGIAYIDMGVFTFVQGLTQLVMMVVMFLCIVTSSFGVIPLSLYFANSCFQIAYISLEAALVYTSSMDRCPDDSSMFRYLLTAVPLNIIFAFIFTVLSLVIIILNKKNLSLQDVYTSYQ